MRTKLLCRVAPAVLVVLALPSISAAYQQPLSPESVREAYFLGRQTERAGAFLRRYTQTPFAPLGSLVDVARIALLTPYAQIVSASHSDMADQNAVDVDQEYSNRSLPLLVRLWLYPPARYVGPFQVFDASVRKLSIVVSQSRRIAARGSAYTTLYSAGDAGRWPSGLEVELTFDAGQFRPAPVNVVVSSPGGGRVSAAFDLSTLQ